MPQETTVGRVVVREAKTGSLVPSDYVPLFYGSGERREGEDLHVLSCGTYAGVVYFLV